MGVYNFLKTAAGRLGVGTSDLALQRPRPVPVYSMYGPAYNVQRQLVTTAGGYMKMGQEVVPVSLSGNGALIHGTPLLVPLAEEAKEG